MMQRLSLSISAFSSSKGPTSKGSYRNKYVTAFLRWIRKGQVAQMQKLLDNSLVYQEILKKDAEMRAAERA